MGKGVFRQQIAEDGRDDRAGERPAREAKQGIRREAPNPRSGRRGGAARQLSKPRSTAMIPAGCGCVRDRAAAIHTTRSTMPLSMMPERLRSKVTKAPRHVGSALIPRWALLGRDENPAWFQPQQYMVF